MGRRASDNGNGSDKLENHPRPNWILIGGSVILLLEGVYMWSTANQRRAAHLRDEQEDGRILYRLNCASCHEQENLGLIKEPPRLQGLFHKRLLPSGAPATDEEVYRTITLGKNTMPAFDQRLTDAEVREIVAYLHTK